MKRRIDHSNYEAWLLDRLEGNLTPAQEAKLDAFLTANPGLDDGLDELPTLADLEATLPQSHKDALKRDLPPTGMPGEPIDDFLIARSEGDLSPAQEEALRSYLAAHPAHQRAERLYANTKLLPQEQQYPNKGNLLRELPPTGLPTMQLLDDFLVARLEGDLQPAQEAALEGLIAADKQAATGWQRMQLAKVLPTTAVYPDKASLKKGGRIIALGAARTTWAVHLRVAATVAVLLGMGTWVLLREPQQARMVAVENMHTPVVVQGVDGTTHIDASTGDATITPANVADAATPDRLRKDTPQGVAQKGERSVPLPEVGPDRPSAGTELLAARPITLPGSDQVRAQPLDAALPAMPTGADPQQEELLLAEAPTGIPLGTFLTNAFRKRVLDVPAVEDKPLGTDDALAAVDKGLRSLGGNRAGLVVERHQDGGLRGFDLRLGRNLSITAGQ